MDVSLHADFDARRFSNTSVDGAAALLVGVPSVDVSVSVLGR